jgi:hypothetical protein
LGADASALSLSRFSRREKGASCSSPSSTEAETPPREKLGTTEGIEAEPRLNIEVKADMTTDE